ncbi:MAG: hypothetical protein LBV52_05255 [Spirochaetaceae bacterium]|jgi:energy-converting hydrogenase Eha subunit C|nr:hypothetical protein [Spirochaetaceae bacterium]
MQGHVKKRNQRLSILIIGFVLFSTGTILVLSTFSDLSNVSVLVSAIAVIIGFLSYILTVKLKKPAWYLFISLIIGFVGLYFLILFSNAFAPYFTFGRTWPVFSILVGIALIPVGWRRYGGFKLFYVVPAISFVVLGAFLFLLSSGILQIDVKKFILKALPVFMVISGLFMIFASLFTSKKK